MLNDIDFFANTEKVDCAYSDAKELFGEHKPYTKKRTLEKDVYMYVFNTHFTVEAVAALTTQCMSNLSPEEGEFLQLFIEWQNFLRADLLNPIVPGSVEDTFVTTERAPLEAFNNWLVDEIAGTPHPETC